MVSVTCARKLSLTDMFAGSLSVHHIKPPLPRSIRGKFHILFAHLRQLHLTAHLLSKNWEYDVYFVDQLATCIPFLRFLGHTRVVFYYHCPDKLLVNGAFVEGEPLKKNLPFLKKLYRMPMDWLEEVTTSMYVSVRVISLIDHSAQDKQMLFSQTQPSQHAFSRNTFLQYLGYLV